MTPTARFERALNYTCIVHGGHTRKGKSIPYVAHLLAVASLALESDADEETAIAALLHDAVEDAGGLYSTTHDRVHTPPNQASIHFCHKNLRPYTEGICD